MWSICPMQSAWTVGDGTVADGCFESRIVVNENGKPIRIGHEGRVDSPEPQSIGEELSPARKAERLRRDRGVSGIPEMHRARGSRDDGSKTELVLRMKRY